VITQLILDVIWQGERIPEGTPVRFCDWLPGEMVEIELPDGRIIQAEAAAVSSGVNFPEETIAALAAQTGIGYDTLVKAARESRLLARKSGATWLSTVAAVEAAREAGTIR